ncbi:MAG: adenosylcobinamide-GDP ribazoletransferase [Halobacteriota archaeon]
MRVRQVLEPLRSGFGFLTTIPVGFSEEGLESLAAHMWVYIVVGAVIGLIIGGINSALALVPNISGFVRTALVLVALYALTGFIHLDGLADVGDGLLKHGTMQERLDVIKEPYVGVGGISFCVLAFLLLFASATSIKPTILIPAFITAEVAGKLSMVQVGSFGKATHKGLGSLFSERSGVHTFLLALLLASLASVICFGVRGMLLLILPIAVSFGLLGLAEVAFGGISGDVIGASNELGRLAALVFISFL